MRADADGAKHGDERGQQQERPQTELIPGRLRGGGGIRLFLYEISSH